MKILFLSRWFPYPLDNGSRIRIFNLIKYLAGEHEIDLVSFASGDVSRERLLAMQQYCRIVEVVQYQSFRPQRWKAVLGFLSRRPRSVVDTYNLKMKQTVEEIYRPEKYDVVIASQIDMVLYALLLKGRPRIIEELELMTLHDRYYKQDRLVQRIRNGLTWWKLSRYVAELLRAFQGVTVVSELEREQIRRISPTYQQIEVIPNGADIIY